jgi:hypothetical protein
VAQEVAQKIALSGLATAQEIALPRLAAAEKATLVGPAGWEIALEIVLPKALGCSAQGRQQEGEDVRARAKQHATTRLRAITLRAITLCFSCRAAAGLNAPRLPLQEPLVRLGKCK